MRDASRILGTDGMLHLLDEELSRMDAEIEALGYSELSANFQDMNNTLQSVTHQTEEWYALQNDFETNMSKRMTELQTKVDNNPATYNNFDYGTALSQTN